MKDNKIQPKINLQQAKRERMEMVKSLTAGNSFFLRFFFKQFAEKQYVSIDGDEEKTKKKSENAEDDGEEAEDEDMADLLGFSGFGTTKVSFSFPFRHSNCLFVFVSLGETGSRQSVGSRSGSSFKE
jgi:hypothetical protein